MKTYLLEKETKARDHDSLGSTICAIRKSIGMSQRELAQLVDVPTSLIIMIELDSVNPEPDILYKISKEIRCNYMYLMMIAGYIEYQPALNILLELFHKLSDNEIEKLMHIVQDVFPDQYDRLYTDAD